MTRSTTSTTSPPATGSTSRPPASCNLLYSHGAVLIRAVPFFIVIPASRVIPTFHVIPTGAKRSGWISFPLSSRPERSEVEGSPSPCHPDRSVAKWRDLLLVLSNFPCYAIIRPLLWSGIEEVITGLTRNQFVGQPARGFESHPLRQKRKHPIAGCFRFFELLEIPNKPFIHQLILFK